MKETLAEIASLLAQGAPAGLANWWRSAQRGINRLLKMILVWPVAMIACAMWSNSIAQKVVPLLALMPVFFFLYFMLKFVNPATVGMLAIPKARELLQKVARQVGLLVAVECGLGLFLWFVPISNDRWLAPVLLLAVLAFFGLKLADIGGGLRAVLALLIVGIAGVFMLGGRSKLGDLGKSVASDNRVRPTQLNYNAIKICDDAFKQQYDFHTEQSGHKDIVLKDGCFGGFVRWPDAWKNWYYQPVGDTDGWWVSFWYSGTTQPAGPYGPNQIPEHMTVPSRYFRLQGHGTIRAFSNDVTEPETEVFSPAPPAEPASGAGRSTIVIDSATYGLSCNAARGNDTSNLASQCNGRSSCAYVVSNARPGGDPVPGCDKDYLAQYRCTGWPNLRKATHEPLKNEGYTIVLNCAQLRPVDTSTPSSAQSEAVADASAPAEPADKSEHPVAAPVVAEMDEIMFAVNSCQFTGNSVICSLQFTNRGRDRDMRLGGQFGRTRIIDQSGREYGVQVLQLGARECRGCAVVNKLVKDVPMAAALTFANISPELSVISLLEINYSMDGGGRWSTVQFRGVPVGTPASPK